MEIYQNQELLATEISFCDHVSPPLCERRAAPVLLQQEM